MELFNIGRYQTFLRLFESFLKINLVISPNYWNRQRKATEIQKR